ncbi:MAG: hypothetical protein LRZ85_08870 [Alphaproteobacteria bacterium]|nr:hypothetical protein [Alphaproteobacteria bacterium]
MEEWKAIQKALEQETVIENLSAARPKSAKKIGRIGYLVYATITSFIFLIVVSSS